MFMKLRVTLSLLFTFFKAFGQQETYFYKIQALTAKVHLDSELYKSIDSLKKTRRPNGSYVKVVFNRDLDFGYKQERVQIVFNSSCSYQVNLLVKNDTICFSSTIFCNVFGSYNAYEAYFNKKHGIPVIDSTKTLDYLNLRNRFYNSAKTLNDLKNEIERNEIYALRAGDDYSETWSKKHIDTLVKRKNYVELEKMLKSINCETQTYGVRGFDLLKRNRLPISSADQKIIDHIKKRNSDLESFTGDVGPIIWKAYK
jgi:hypothetical protein